MRVEYREEPCRTALNPVQGMGFRWSLNPYMGCVHRCTFCYVRGFEQRADRPSDDRYGASIRVKVNVVEVLERELRRRSWRCEPVTIGAATDPYQPAEGRYRLTRRCIEALAAAKTPLNVITRGPLVVRDIDVLSAAAARVDVGVSMSVGTLDLDVWRKTEPSTAPPLQRLRAVTALVDAGISTSVAIAPVLPGLTDRPDQLEAVVAAARNAGATGLWCNVLNLRPGTREHYVAGISRHWPELLPEYERLYTRSYLRPEDEAPRKQAVDELRERYAIADRRPAPIVPPPPERQLTFAL